MPTQLEDKPKQIYDDENKSWYFGRKKSATDKEIENLEKNFDGESAKPEDLPDGHPSKGKSSKENESNAVANLGTKASSSIKRKLKGKQKLIIGGVIGTSIGGILAIFGVLSGPIQMVHLAQILGNSSRPTDGMVRIRSGSMLRNARAADAGDVSVSRLSRIGYRVFGNARTQLQSIGVDFSTTPGSNRPNRITINPERHPLLQNRTATPDQMRNTVARHYGINPSRVTAAAGPGAPINIDIQGLNTGAVRALIDTSLSPLEDGKITRSMNKRVMAKYFNVPSLFRPLQRTSAEIENRITTRIQRRAAEKERRQTRRATFPEKYSSALRELNKQINSYGRSLARGAMLQGYLCAGAELYEIIPLINYANVVVPSMLDATEKQAIGSQIQSTNDLDLNTLNTTLETLTYDAELSIQELNEVDQLEEFEEEELRAMDGKSIWSSKPLNALAYGGEGSGEEINDAYYQAFSGQSPLDAFSFLGSKVIQDGACSFLAQTAGVIIGGVTLITPGPGWLARGGAAAGQAALAYKISGIMRNFALERFTENAVEAFSGPQGGSLIAFGSMAANNLNATSMGGVALSNDQSNTLAQSAVEVETRELTQKPFLARVFDPYDYRSITGQIINNSNQSIQDTTLDFIAIVSNPLSVASKAIGSLTNTAYADTNSYDWGFPVYGIPPELLDDDRFEDPYENGRAVIEILESEQQSEKAEEFKSRARVCFGVSVTKRGGEWTVLRDEFVNPLEEDYIDLDPACNDFSWSDDWTRFVLFIFDNSIITNIDCYEGNKESCADLGLNPSQFLASDNNAVTQVVGDPNAPSENVPCAPGTKDLGTETPTYSSGERIPTRLCEIEEWRDYGGSSGLVPGSGNGVVVNSRVSGAWLALYNAAVADGIDLRVTSSFRSFERQAQICGPDGRRGCARPGYSNHQTGHAIDFANIYSYVGGRVGARGSCQTARGNPEWEWLVDNAERFGFGQLPIEAWHWDADYSGGCE